MALRVLRLDETEADSNSYYFEPEPILSTSCPEKMALSAVLGALIMMALGAITSALYCYHRKGGSSKSNDSIPLNKPRRQLPPTPDKISNQNENQIAPYKPPAVYESVDKPNTRATGALASNRAENENQSKMYHASPQVLRDETEYHDNLYRERAHTCAQEREEDIEKDPELYVLCKLEDSVNNKGIRTIRAMKARRKNSFLRRRLSVHNNRQVRAWDSRKGVRSFPSRGGYGNNKRKPIGYSMGDYDMPENRAGAYDLREKCAGKFESEGGSSDSAYEGSSYYYGGNCSDFSYQSEGKFSFEGANERNNSGLFVQGLKNGDNLGGTRTTAHFVTRDSQATQILIVPETRI